MADFRIGVVANNLKMSDPVSTVRAARQVGVECLQIAAPPPTDVPIRAWADNWLAAAKDSGVAIASTFTGFKQENYQTIQTIHETGGLVPDGLAEDNIARVVKAAESARAVGVDLLTLHGGFIPESKDDPVFAKLLDRIGRAADGAARFAVRIGLESGQESAKGLKQFLAELARPNVGCNFDPANMILYGRQNPLEAVDVLAEHIFQVHAKDAKWSDQPGVTWGRDVRLGDGDVQFSRLIAHLRALSFRGDLIIEREAGEDRLADIAAAAALLRAL